MLKKLLFVFLSLFSIQAYSLDYEIIVVTNSNGEVKEIKIPIIGSVKEIYEVRNFDYLTNIDYSANIYIHKLLPPMIIYDNATVPDIELTDIDVQDIEVQNLMGYDIQILNLDTDELNVVDNTVTDLKASNIVVIVDANVFSYLEDLRKRTIYENMYNQDYLKRAYLKDFQNISEDLQTKWCNVFAQNIYCNISFIKDENKPKMLSEIKLVDNEYDKDLLKNNLQVVKSLGYDSVLLKYDCSENIDVMLELMNDIKKSGLKIYIVYVGLINKERTWNPFIDPDKISTFIYNLAKKADGMLLNWRGTSAHVKLLPIEFFNFLCNTARQYNYSIPIYGEVFYGRVDYLNKKMLVKTIPENVNGVLIDNMGYYGYNHAYIVNKLYKNQVKNWSKLDKLGMVIGYQPYYLTKDKVNMTFTEEYYYKKDVENSFNSVNCSTVTMLHDGVDEYLILNGTYQTNDNILYDTNLKIQK